MLSYVTYLGSVPNQSTFENKLWDNQGNLNTDKTLDYIKETLFIYSDEYYYYYGYVFLSPYILELQFEIFVDEIMCFLGCVSK